MLKLLAEGIKLEKYTSTLNIGLLAGGNQVTHQLVIKVKIFPVFK